jgi:hypothetical protein
MVTRSGASRCRHLGPFEGLLDGVACRIMIEHVLRQYPTSRPTPRHPADRIGRAGAQNSQND